MRKQGWGFAHRALLMGTLCAGRQEAVYSGRLCCHRRGGRQSGMGERETEGGGLLFLYFVYRLLLVSAHGQLQSHTHTHTKAKAPTDSHTTMHTLRQ